jgi:nucleobase:cation symporter-1, NCS1 family
MGPIAGILCSDFYLVRNKKLDVRAMYDPHGRYRYYHGWHWRAWLTFAIVVAPILPGFAQSINPSINVSEGALHLYTFSWLWGFVMCALIYYVICRFISPPTASYVDVAVFPPKTEEEEAALIAGSQIVEGTPSDTPSIDKKLDSETTTKFADEKV